MRSGGDEYYYGNSFEWTPEVGLLFTLPTR
jgi:hypothetical protein